MRGGLCPAGPEPIYSQGREGGSPGQRTPVLPSCSQGLQGHGTPHSAESRVTRGTLEPQLSQPRAWEGATRGEACSPGAQAPRMSWDCGGGAGRLCLGQGNFSAHSCPLSLAAPAQEGRPGQLRVGVGVCTPRHSAVSGLQGPWRPAGTWEGPQEKATEWGLEGPGWDGWP